MNQQQPNDVVNTDNDADKALTVEALREVTGGALEIERAEVRTEVGTWPSKSRSSSRSYATG